MNTLTRKELAEIIFSTCMGCENTHCVLTNIWPELKKPLSEEEKDKLQTSVKKRLNIKAGQKQVQEAILNCPDCNPYDHSPTLGRCTL